MSKTLRLGFIMGGGVSLGSFSSAALCESIKQLLVYAEYEDTAGQKRPYARIEIDVLTGSSAGAISLGIMLRGWPALEINISFWAITPTLILGKNCSKNCWVNLGRPPIK